MEVIKEQNYLRGALDQVNERFSSLDARIVSVENRMISLEERMISLEACVSEVQSRLSRKIRDNLRWLIGMMIPVWFGILVAIIVELVKG
jgi:tetrahydromethanopterin S-methyltransferase subunit G